MKPFNLEEAKAGKPVVTRDGRSVRIICWDRESEEGYNIVALIGGRCYEEAITCTKEGKTILGTDNLDDLFMASEKNEGWINIYKDSNRTPFFKYIYDTKEEAFYNRNLNSNNTYIMTIKINWEE